MKVKFGLGVALLTACGGGSGQVPGQSQQQARAERARSEAGATPAGAEVAGGETTEFSGDIGACPEIVSSEPLDLDDPEPASWVAMAQGHHEQTLGWRRLVLSDEVTGFAEHTSVSIDVTVLRGREVVYGSGGNSADYELGGCDGLRGRQIELEIALATADGAVATSFRRWFEPAIGLPSSESPGALVLREGWLNPDKDRDGVVPSGSLELGLDPALGGTPRMWVSVEFSADSVQGSLSPELSLQGDLPDRSTWTPVEAIFPDEACGSGGRTIGLDESFEGLGETPRAYYERMARVWESEPIPAVWKGSRYGVELNPLDVPPPTEVSLDAGEPTHACVSGDWITVFAPLTVTTADGRVNLTQPFGSELFAENGAGIISRTPWVPAADFGEHMGVGGVDLPSGAYGSINFHNSVDWQDARVEGSLEVSQWDAFSERAAAYPALEWCRGGRCIPETE